MWAWGYGDNVSLGSSGEVSVLLIFRFCRLYLPNHMPIAAIQIAKLLERPSTYDVSLKLDESDCQHFIGQICKFSYSHCFVCLCVCVCVCYNRLHTLCLSESQKCKNDLYRFWHLPSNGVNVKIVHHDFDILFEGQSVCETVRGHRNVLKQVW